MGREEGRTSSRPTVQARWSSRNLTSVPRRPAAASVVVVSSSALRSRAETGCAATLWVRKRIRSRLDASAQCTSSSRSNTGAAAARSASSASVSSNTRSCVAGALASVARAYPKRSERVDERLVRQLSPDEVDRSPRQDVKPIVARAPPPRPPTCVLPMPASPQMSPVAPRPCRAEASMPSSTLISLSRPTKNNVSGGPSIHPVSRRPQATGEHQAQGNGRVRRRGRKISPLARCGTGRRTNTLESTGSTRTRRREMTVTCTATGHDSHEDAHGRGRRRGAPARARVGPRDIPADRVPPRVVAEPPVWEAQTASTLRDEFRLVAVDLRGHGMSDAPPEAEQYTNSELWADDLAAVIEQLGLERPVLVGWSYGAFVICDYLVSTAGSCRRDRLRRRGGEAGRQRLRHAHRSWFSGSLRRRHVRRSPTAIRGMRGLVGAFSVEPLATMKSKLLCSSMVVPASIRQAWPPRARLRRRPAHAQVPVVSAGRSDTIVLPAMAGHLVATSPRRRCPGTTARHTSRIRRRPERFNRELAALSRRTRTTSAVR